MWTYQSRETYDEKDDEEARKPDDQVDRIFLSPSHSNVLAFDARKGFDEKIGSVPRQEIYNEHPSFPARARLDYVDFFHGLFVPFLGHLFSCVHITEHVSMNQCRGSSL